MRKLLRLIALISLSLSVALAVMIRAAYRETPARVSFIFAHPDGTRCDKPCLFGIQPGVTTFNDAYAMLKSHPLLQPEDPQERNPNLDEWGQFYFVSLPQSSLWLDIAVYAYGRPNTSGQRIVSSMSLLLKGDAPTLAEFSLLFAKPYHIDVMKEGDGTYYFSSIDFVIGEYVYRLDFDIVSENLAFRPLQTPKSILFAETRVVEAFDLNRGNWLGFTSYDRYFAEQE